MADRIICENGGWAIASDGIQWMLMRRYSGGWKTVSFVRSHRDILARCMREKGTDEPTAIELLSGLPDTFDQWKALHAASEVPQMDAAEIQ